MILLKGVKYYGARLGPTRLPPRTDAPRHMLPNFWAVLKERCDAEAFNITNGGFDRREYLWPRLARFLRMEYAPPQRFPFVEFMSDKEPL